MAARRPKQPGFVAVASLADTGDPATDRVMIQAEQNLQDLQAGARAATKTATTQAASAASQGSAITALTTRVTTAEAKITTLQGEVSGRLLAAPLTLTGSGSGTLPAGTTMIRLRFTGAGGGGGGAAGGANSAAGAGGNSGTYLEIIIGSPGGAVLPSAYSWSAGTGGTAGSSAGGTGGTGGDSTFTHNSITYTAKGGAGGGGAANLASSFGAPAARTPGSSAALVNVQQQGEPGVNINNFFWSGQGGSNPMGGGGGLSGSTAANGNDGSLYGGGGGGAIAQATGRAGGVGADGGEILECLC